MFTKCPMAGGIVGPAVLFSCLSALTPAGVCATTFYVSINGSDTQSGTLETPFRSIQRAVDSASAGDKIVVRDGTYGPNGAITCGDACEGNPHKSPVVIARGGAAGAPLILTAEHKWGAVLDCQMLCDSYIEIASTAAYINIEQFVITRSYWDGIHSNGHADHIVVRHNRFEYIGNRPTNTRLGLVGMYTTRAARAFVIDGNVFHDIGRTNTDIVNRDHGLYLHGDDITVINNVFYNLTRGWGIQLSDSLSNVVIGNNTFVFPNPYRRGQIVFDGNVNRVSIRNNIFYQPQQYAVQNSHWMVESCEISHNLVFGADAMTSGSWSCAVTDNQVGVDPLFLNATDPPYDFRIGTGSPAEDAGITLPEARYDLDGVPRPQGTAYDIGAYERTNEGPRFREPAPARPRSAVGTGGVNGVTKRRR